MRSRIALLMVALTGGCAGVRVEVLQGRGRPVDAIAVAPLRFEFPTTPLFAYQKNHELVEATRAAGGFVIVGASHDDPEGAPGGPSEVSVLQGTVERTVVHQSVSSGPSSSGVFESSAIRFTFIHYRLVLVLREADGRLLARATVDRDDELHAFDPTRPDDRQPTLTVALHEATSRLLALVSLRRRASIPELRYVETHRRLFGHAAARNDEERVLQICVYKYFYPTLPAEWLLTMTTSGEDGLLVTDVPPAWFDRGLLPGDVLLTVDGRRVTTAAAGDSAFSAGRPTALEILRDGASTTIALAPIPQTPNSSIYAARR